MLTSLVMAGAGQNAFFNAVLRRRADLPRPRAEAKLGERNFIWNLNLADPELDPLVLFW